MPENDQNIQIGIYLRIPMRIGTEQDYPLGLEFRRNTTVVVVALDEADHYVDGVVKSIDFRLTDASYENLLNNGLNSKVEFKLSMGRYKIKEVVREGTPSQSAENFSICNFGTVARGMTECFQAEEMRKIPHIGCKESRRQLWGLPPGMWLKDVGLKPST